MRFQRRDLSSAGTPSEPSCAFCGSPLVVRSRPLPSTPTPPPPPHSTPRRSVLNLITRTIWKIQSERRWRVGASQGMAGGGRLERYSEDSLLGADGRSDVTGAGLPSIWICGPPTTEGGRGAGRRGSKTRVFSSGGNITFLVQLFKTCCPDDSVLTEI